MTQEHPAEAPPAVRLRGLRKVFGAGSAEVVAVDGVDLDVADGEFFSMLGPSGSGKTTVLRLVAGFELPTAGRWSSAAATSPGSRRSSVTSTPSSRTTPCSRTSTCSGTSSTACGCARWRGPSAGPGRNRRSRRSAWRGSDGGARPAVRRAAAAGRARPRPGEPPRVLLLDEPLGALDLKLREEMQVELKAIQREVGITFVFVTHDQEEALTLSDRVAVFSKGRIEQVGTPREVYERP